MQYFDKQSLWDNFDKFRQAVKISTGKSEMTKDEYCQKFGSTIYEVLKKYGYKKGENHEN